MEFEKYCARKLQNIFMLFMYVYRYYAQQLNISEIHTDKVCFKTSTNVYSSSKKIIILIKIYSF